MTADKQLTEPIEEIDGGSIVGSVEPVNFRDRHREETARTLAITLVAILGVSACLHYISLWVLLETNQSAAIEPLEHFFNAWLPVISGLVGSATTYYFTKSHH